MGSSAVRGRLAITPDAHLLLGSAARTEQAPGHEDDDQTEGNVGGLGARLGGRAAAFGGVDGSAPDFTEVGVVERVEVDVDGEAAGEERHVEFAGGVGGIRELNQLDAVSRDVDLREPPSRLGERIVRHELVRQSRAQGAQEQALDLELHILALVDADQAVAVALANDAGLFGIRDVDVELCSVVFGEDHAVGGEAVARDADELVLSGVEAHDDAGDCLARDFVVAAGDAVAVSFGERAEIVREELSVVAVQLFLVDLVDRDVVHDLGIVADQAASGVEGAVRLARQVALASEVSARGAAEVTAIALFTSVDGVVATELGAEARLASAGPAGFDLANVRAAVPARVVAVVACFARVDHTVVAGVEHTGTGVVGAGRGAAQGAAVEAEVRAVLTVQVRVVAVLGAVSDAVAAVVAAGVVETTAATTGERATLVAFGLAVCAVEIGTVAVLAGVDVAVAAVQWSGAAARVEVAAAVTGERATRETAGDSGAVLAMQVRAVALLGRSRTVVAAGVRAPGGVDRT